MWKYSEWMLSLLSSLYVYILILLSFSDKLGGQLRSMKHQNLYCPYARKCKCSKMKRSH